MKRFKNILYVADPSGLVLQAFHHAVGLAERNNARLTVVMVLEHLPSYLMRPAPDKLRQVQRNELQAALDRLCAWVSHRVKVEARILEGKPFLAVIREVIRNECDLVVKSVDDDDSTKALLFGSTDMHLLRKCPCPVWLIKSTDPSSIRRVMACVHFNELDPSGRDTDEPLNRMILELAGSLARQEASELHIAHAWEAMGENVLRGSRTDADEEEVNSYVREVGHRHRLWLERLLRKSRQWIGPGAYDSLKRKTHVVKGPPDEVILKIVHVLRVDLIIMGTVARAGIPGIFIGNTAETILSKIDCSVLAVKPRDFVTPVTCES
ncbi:MAG: universal stress protein [Tistlia sp.]|uniref:universal stress protein n=1 Tax=Tistlia sp. TaxID=3057121 RepID=UPI0034A5B437